MFMSANGGGVKTFLNFADDGQKEVNNCNICAYVILEWSHSCDVQFGYFQEFCISKLAYFI